MARNPIRFHYSLIDNISVMNWHLTLIFYIQIDMNERIANLFSEKTLLSESSQEEYGNYIKLY